MSEVRVKLITQAQSEGAEKMRAELAVQPLQGFGQALRGPESHRGFGS